MGDLSWMNTFDEVRFFLFWQSENGRQLISIFYKQDRQSNDEQN